ncbi:hypothetical protein [Streptomyces broussonetiae]|uniref:hypothetical protein n=1 Tax=Streptomyces broussonetiae TaxID=2686304 RepID=UPI0035DD98E0
MPVPPGAQPDRLLAPTGTFSNRGAELDRLDTVCGEPGRVALAGLPGVGRTAIACRWADKERDRFPDGLFSVDRAAPRDESAVGAAMGPAETSQALASILWALLGSDAHVCERFEEPGRQYETHSRGRRMPVLIDNVTLAAQVRALAPAGRSTTSSPPGRSGTPRPPRVRHRPEGCCGETVLAEGVSRARRPGPPSPSAGS